MRHHHRGHGDARGPRPRRGRIVSILRTEGGWRRPRSGPAAPPAGIFGRPGWPPRSVAVGGGSAESARGRARDRRPPFDHPGDRSPEQRPCPHFAPSQGTPMSQFKSTNVYVEWDSSYCTVKDPQTNQPVMTGDCVRWEKEVLGVLEDLYLNSKLSRLLFDALQQAGYNPKSGKHDRRLVIKPYTEADEKNKGVCGAYASPEDWRKSFTSERVDGTSKDKGDGTGSSTTIHFDKARWVNGGKCGGYASQPGGAADEVLLHEMLHGLRHMAGQQDMSAIGGGYNTIEEFYAILLTNICMSERGRTLLRKNHSGVEPLDKAMSGSTG